MFISKRENHHRFAFEGGDCRAKAKKQQIINIKQTLMKKCSLRGIALAAIAGLALTLRAQDTTDQSQFPAVVQQPVDGAIPVGASTTFSVQATNADGYQWMKNGVAMDGETNSSITINSVSTNDVGYYSAAVIQGSEVVPTRSASLNVMAPLTDGGPIVVFGLP